MSNPFDGIVPPSRAFGSLPILAEWTNEMAANVTETAASDTAGRRGMLLVHTSATATSRLSTRYKAGTSIIAWYSGIVPALTDVTTAAGYVTVALSRPLTDGAKVSMGVGPSGSAFVGACMRAFRWTTKDTFGVELTVPARVVPNTSRFGIYVRLNAGNIECGYTVDGVTFTPVYSAATATAFGSAGDPTRVEFGTILQANGMIGHALLEGVTVS